MPWWRSSSFSRHSLESPSRKKDCFWSTSDPTSSTDSMSVYPNTGGHRRSFLHLQWRHKYIPHSTEPDVVIPRTRLSSSEPSPETTPLSQSPRSLEQTLVRGSCCIPQPLPLPGSAAPSSKRDMQYGVIHNGNSGDRHLPTPRETSCRSTDIDKDKGEISNGDMTGTGRRSQLEAQTQNRVVRPRSDVKFEEDGNPTEKAKHRFRLSVPVKSAPTSPISSPMLSPRWMGPREMFPSQYSPPQGFQVWSAPEFLSLGRENSPLPSPRSANVSCQNPSTETRENNALVKNVHPLPLPPRAAALPPSTPKASNSMTSQWQKGKLIGRGTFGTVFMATNRETGALCAMKEVEILHDDIKSAESIKQLQQEIKVLSKLKHPNIVQYYGSEIVEDKFYIYLEYVYPGSINKYVREHCGAVTESVVRNFTRHILSGLAYLHRTKTVHRDIKGANLLVDATGVVKLADFGTAKHLNGENAALSLKGSPYWMAPELMHAVIQKDNNPDFAFAIDVWSLGCTIIEMLEGKPPWSEYEGAAALFKVMRESPSVPESLSREGKDFLHCCFKRNPGERPSAVKLLEHPFLKNSHGHKLMTRARSHKERLSPSVRNGRSPSPHNSNAAAATPDVALMRNRKATYKSSGFSHYLSPLWLMRHHETKLPS